MTSAGPTLQFGSPSTGEKQAAQRADFTQNRHELLVEMHGYRLAWSRAAQCFCAPLNDQTEQADPDCPQCAGAGYLYFPASTEPQDPSLVGDLTEVQRLILASSNASVIRGIMTGLGTSETPFDRLGKLLSGQSVVTVRPNNRIGYLDRLIALDSLIIYTERVYWPGEDAPLPLRYLVDGGVNLLASASQRYVPDEDFVVSQGLVRFVPGREPSMPTYLAAHYNCHPHYLVVEQPHASRLTYIPRAKAGAGAKTPEGNVVQMPLQAVVRLDWLVGRDQARTLA